MGGTSGFYDYRGGGRGTKYYDNLDDSDVGYEVQQRLLMVGGTRCRSLADASTLASAGVVPLPSSRAPVPPSDFSIDRGRAQAGFTQNFIAIPSEGVAGGASTRGIRAFMAGARRGGGGDSGGLVATAMCNREDFDDVGTGGYFHSPSGASEMPS